MKNFAQQKFKYKHRIFRKKGKKVLIKKRSAKFCVIAKTKKILVFTVKHIEIYVEYFIKKLQILGWLYFTRIIPQHL